MVSDHLGFSLMSEFYERLSAATDLLVSYLGGLIDSVAEGCDIQTF